MVDARQVVLAGAGHAHLHVAAQGEAFARRGVRLALVDPGALWYSGLATGVLAGQYAPETDQVDPARLVERNGGAFVRDRLVGVDPAGRRAFLASGESLDYDLLSLNIGSEVDTSSVAGARDHAWTVKPISNLWRLRTALTERFEQSDADPARVVVVGGGPTGSEVAACIDAFARRSGVVAEVGLCSRSDRLMPGVARGASRSLERSLGRRGIRIHAGCAIDRVDAGGIVAADGRRLAADVVVVATGLAAASALRQFGLPLAGDGGLRVRPTLQTIGDDRIFAAGDCAHIEGHALPKLGVFGVRAAPVLLQNLLASLDGRPLEPYRPQKRYLMILNYGDGEALAIYGNLYWTGRLSFLLKDRIDRRFLDRYR